MHRGLNVKDPEEEREFKGLGPDVLRNNQIKRVFGCLGL